MADSLSRVSLGAAIARRREAVGMTQRELGDVTGVGQTGVSRIESGIRKVDTIELVSIAEALGLEIGQLVDLARGAGQASVDVVALRGGNETPELIEAIEWVQEFMSRLETLESLERDG